HSKCSRIDMDYSHFGVTYFSTSNSKYSVVASNCFHTSCNLDRTLIIQLRPEKVGHPESCNRGAGKKPTVEITFACRFSGLWNGGAFLLAGCWTEEESGVTVAVTP